MQSGLTFLWERCSYCQMQPTVGGDFASAPHSETGELQVGPWMSLQRTKQTCCVSKRDEELHRHSSNQFTDPVGWLHLTGISFLLHRLAGERLFSSRDQAGHSKCLTNDPAVQIDLLSNHISHTFYLCLLRQLTYFESPSFRL